MTRDGHIRLLPVHVANKIAAGEVVERPAAALKELLENALDARARRIDVSVTAGGKKLVSVRDDGCGMNREDALMSLERQATSKIRDVDDIERIDTLGFRGEAIPSIAAVSRFTLVTRPQDAEEATRVKVNAGVVAEVSTCGAPPGTTVEVRDLFCNVPARLKFLRSFATEEEHVRATFVDHALAHPDVGFSLTLDGREAYRFAPNATLEERVADLFGADFAAALIPVGTPEGQGVHENDGPRVIVHGYVERPGSAYTTRHDQFIFVNGRPASAAIIARAVKDACPTRQADARPAMILFIDLPPADVDVNVHPAKREVRFRHPMDVKNAICDAFAAALAATPASASATIAEAPPPEPSTPRRLPDAMDILAPTSGDVNNPFLKQAPFQPTLPRATPAGTNASAGMDAPAEPAASAGTDASGGASSAQPATDAFGLQSPSGPWRFFNFLAQTASGYFLLETDAGVVTLNPIAAQERIIYEKLLKRDADGRAASQQLLLPETAQFSPVESARLKAFLPVLEAQGFALEEFGRDTWKIDAVPAVVAETGAAKLLASIVYDLTENGSRRGGNAWREELTARSLARSFAGAARKFTADGARKLVEDLARTSMPYVCPRGKPVMIFVSNRELERKFSR